MKYCQFCGNSLRDDANFCEKCGKPIAPASNESHVNNNPFVIPTFGGGNDNMESKPVNTGPALPSFLFGGDSKPSTPSAPTPAPMNNEFGFNFSGDGLFFGEEEEEEKDEKKEKDKNVNKKIKWTILGSLIVIALIALCVFIAEGISALKITESNAQYLKDDNVLNYDEAVEVLGKPELDVTENNIRTCEWSSWLTSNVIVIEFEVQTDKEGTYYAAIEVIYNGEELVESFIQK